MFLGAPAIFWNYKEVFVYYFLVFISFYEPQNRMIRKYTCCSVCFHFFLVKFVDKTLKRDFHFVCNTSQYQGCRCHTTSDINAILTFTVQLCVCFCYQVIWTMRDVVMADLTQVVVWVGIRPLKKSENMSNMRQASEF